MMTGRKHSIGLKSLAEATRIRERLLAAFEWAERSTDPAEISAVADVRDRGRRGERGGAGRVDPRVGGCDAAAGLPADPAGGRRGCCCTRAGRCCWAGFRTKLSRLRAGAAGADAGRGAYRRVGRGGGCGGGDGRGQRIEAANVFWCAGGAATPVAAVVGGEGGEAWGGAGRAGLLGAGVSGGVRDRGYRVAGWGGWEAVAGGGAGGGAAGRYVGDVIAARVGGAGGAGSVPVSRSGQLGGDRPVGGGGGTAVWAKLTGFVAWVMWGGVHLFLLNGLRNRILGLCAVDLGLAHV